MQNGNSLATSAATHLGFPNNLMCGFMSPNGADIPPGALAPNFSQLQFPPGAVMPPNSAPLQLMAAMAAAYNGNVSASSPLTTPASAAAAMMQMHRQQISTSNLASTTTTSSVTEPISTTQALASTPPAQTSNTTPSALISNTNMQKKMSVANSNNANHLLNTVSNNVIDGLAVAAQQQLAMLSAQYSASGFPFNLNNTAGGINPFMMMAGFDPNNLSTVINSANTTNSSTNAAK